MTNEELKKKIVEILDNNIRWQPYYYISRGIVYEDDLKNIADVLIAAGLKFDRNIGIKAIKRVKELEAENAELRARLDKAVELPTIYEHISYPYIERMYSETIYYVIYKENGRIMTEKFGKNKSKAEARLKELKEKNDD